MKPVSKESVVLIHGLWLPELCLRPLARRLERQGLTVHLFSYPSVHADLCTNAGRLTHFLATLTAATVHLVGHSLGGILIRALFHHHPNQKPGRIVTLGTPHGGSQVAQYLSQYACWRQAMGKSVADLLGGIPQNWLPPMREMGTISGRRSFGMGRLVYRHLSAPNDGLLTVEESAFVGACDHIELPVSHTGMLFSCAVARRVSAFLTTGHFDL